MPLQEKIVDIPFTGGIDKKIAEKVLPPGLFTRVENAEQLKTGEIAKRKGHAALSKSIAGGGTLSTARGLATYGDELVLFTDRTAYSYDTAYEKWVSKGTVVPMRLTWDRITQNGATAVNVNTVAYANGYYVYAHYLSGGYAPVSGSQYVIMQAATGNLITSGQTISTATNCEPYIRAVTVGNIVFLVYKKNGTTNIECLRIDLTDPLAAPTTHTLATDLLGLPAQYTYFDAVEYDSSSFNVAYRSNANTVKALYVASDGTVTASGTVQAEDPTQSVCMAKHDSGKAWVFWYHAANGLRARLINPTTIATIGALVTVDAAPGIVQAIVATKTDSTHAHVFYEINGGAGTARDLTYVKDAILDTTPSVTTATAVYLRGVGIASRAWYYNDQSYLALVHEPEYLAVQQNTGFVGDGSGNIVARFLVGVGGQVNSTYIRWSDICSPSAGVYHFSHVILGGAVATAGAAVAEKGISGITLDYTKSCGHAQLVRNLLVLNGMLYAYDRKAFVEHGFHLYPQRISNAAPVGGGGSIAAGTYLYTAVYAWYDNNGQQHLSAAAAPHTVVNGAANASISVNLPTLRLTAKPNVLVLLYRTKASGSIYHYVGYVANDTTVDSVAINDTASDATLDGRDTLYTTGGVLDHIAPPGAIGITEHGNRIFLVTGDHQIHYSKKWSEDQGIAFNDGLRILTEHRGGRTAALASMDGQLIIGKEHRLTRVYGEGPNDLGQGSFSEPVPVSEDIGIKYGAPVAATNFGLVFPSPERGLWLLQRDLSTSYIGAQVEDYNAHEIMGIHKLQDKNQIRILLGSDYTSLIYDHYHKKWSTYKPLLFIGDGVAATVWLGKYTFTNSAAQVYQQDTSYAEGLYEYLMYITTGWLRFAGLAGYKRIWRIYVLGEYKDKHKLNVKLYFPDGTTETHSSDITAADEPYLLAVEPANQKTEAIKVEISDMLADGEAHVGESATFNGLRFVLGVKSKLPVKAAKRI